ncbi:MAG: hypothetical protein RLZZ618_2 [Pseudomonadota bacterium]
MLRILSCSLAVLAAPLVHAQAAPAANAASSPELPTLGTIVIKRHYDNAVGTSDAASQGRIEGDLLKSRPALRPGEVLEFVPGLIVTQHSGDGKANQYFLRGYNLDHGTDFATSLNGMPVNMPTHAHGQGYTDLNFLMPELVDHIDYRKGPYFAQSGDFSLAGAADIFYRRSLPEPLAQLTLGSHHFARAVVAGSHTLGAPGEARGSLLGALELMRNNGPWQLPEKLRKTNAVISFNSGSRARGWSVSAMGYDARWQATDQIPQSAIESGAIDRFGAMDKSDGGMTSRYSLSGDWRDRSESSSLQVSGYLMRYRLQLFSNFTYALDFPVEGDQFEQNDARTVAGLGVTKELQHDAFGHSARLSVGAQLRHDHAQVGLFNTTAQQRFNTVRDDAVRQTSLGLFAEESVPWTDWLRTIAGLRVDNYHFHVDSSQTVNSGSRSATKVSPKLSAIFGPWSKTEFFINAGRGFHSNDARGTTDATAPVPPLVSGHGWELGARTEAVAGLQSSVALWQLRSDSELLYVGDAGTTEPGRPGKRTGFEWNNRWVATPWLLIDADLAWTRARFSDTDPAGDRIPNAVERVASLAVTLRELGPWSGSLQWRYLGARPLVEDNSVRAPSTLLTNLRVGHKLTPKIDLTLDVFNLLDRQVNDIEYHYESSQGLGKHVHPAEPRTVRFTAQARF